MTCANAKTLSKNIVYKPVYQPLYPEVYHYQETCLDPRVLAFLGTEKNIRQLAYSEQKNILGFRVFNADFCRRLVEELKHLQQWHQQQEIELTPANSMNYSGFSLNELGFDNLLQGLFTQFIKPLAREYFPQFGGNQLQDFHAFVVHYSEMNPCLLEKGLGLHVDASHVTLNLCLGDNFSGSELFFSGERCLDHLEDCARWFEQYQYQPKIGQALLHTGMHRHGVNPILRGERYSLVMWCRTADSSYYHDDKRAQNQCPCHSK